MNFRQGHAQEEPQLNLTPLIDVVFLLLIFFMVSTTFDKQAKLKIVLPEATAAAEQTNDNAVVIGIDSKGSFFINDRQLVNTQSKTLKLALIKIVGDNKDVPLVIRADAKTPHASVVKAMDVAAQLNLTQMSIATLENQSE